MYKHILVPTDGSTLSNKAAKTAARLAKLLTAKITALHVIAPYTPPTGADGMILYAEAFSPQDYDRKMQRLAAKTLAKVETQARALKVACEKVSVIEPAPWEAIIKVARSKRCDLIVMASHGRRGLTGLLLGSETNKVLTHSKTPVLVCR